MTSDILTDFDEESKSDGQLIVVLKRDNLILDFLVFLFLDVVVLHK